MTTLSHKKPRRKNIQHSDPGKILDLVMSLTDDKCSEIQMKINTYLSEECEAELVVPVIVNRDRKEAFVEVVGIAALPRKMKIHLTSKFMDTLKTNVEQTDLLANFGEDFQNIVNPFVGKDTKKRLVLFSVNDVPFTVIFCIVAPKAEESSIPIIIYECGLFVWPTLKKAIAFEYENSLKIKCQQLLRVAKRLFTQVSSLGTLLQIAMDQAKQLTKAEHCVVFLVDVDNMELYESCSTNKDETRRFPLGMGIAGEVIKTGSLINARFPREHPAYNPAIDGIPKIECRNLLCFPIREQTGIIGVGQLINKISDPYFDGMDEEMALAFSIYCGVCILHSVVYQKIQEAHIRNALANELIMYHMKVTDAEVSRMLACTGFHYHPHVTSLHFNPRALPLRELPCYAAKMFVDLGYDVKFNIKPPKLSRFILYVKKGYRDVPYHSWTHAFNVGQWAFAALMNYKLVANGYFTDLQALMYLVAAFMHDIDHRGTTNSFQIHGETTLAALYSSEGSVMERHHLAQAMCILNTEGCDILETLPRRDYDRAIMMLRDNILATDLANYFKNINEYKVVAMDYQRGNRAHFTALQAMLMNAADLGDQLKDWGCVKKTAAAVLTEFFKQGELEKMRGVSPTSEMDSDKCFIPDLEIQFLQTICIPLYDMIGKIIPKAAACTKIIENHVERWEAAKPVFAEVPITAGLSVLLSPELDTLIQLNLKEAGKDDLMESESILPETNTTTS
uniref:Phosphodiesterase n=1 Tax=Spodoptera frugiperda TaxID=7108 RepID=A0A2H1VME5_SPOFR